MLNEILILIMAYLIGSIPSGLVISFCAGYGDIRRIGSGNIGATNVLRTGSKFLALLTLIADAGKVVLAIILANKLGFEHLDYLVASSALIGHLYPVWLKFKGGKGVACFLGLSLYLFPKVALVLVVTWIITFAMFRYSSLASIIAAIAGMIALIIIGPIDGNLFLIISLILLILLKHRDNVIRLIEGKESRFGKAK